MKKILIIDGHPESNSFGSTMAKVYYQGAKYNKKNVRMIKVRNLKFNPTLNCSSHNKNDLESDLIKTQEEIKEASHIVLFLPVWLNAMPALLKGFFDRCFIPGFSHRFSVEKKFPEKLLKGRSISVIYIQGMSRLYTDIVMGDSFWMSVKKGIFKFVGFSSVKRKVFANVAYEKDCELNQILDKVYKLGKKGF